MEYHPDKCRNEFIEAEKVFKRIKEAYDILSNPDLKQKYDEVGKLNEKYNTFVEKNQNVYDQETLDNAFNELIKGGYPKLAAKRNKSPTEFQEIR
mmetsp:Transcript_9204/g.10375  ORF Transcript_9204/g.10375 Transcript_9204/m.10375 type:complete len:95 (-) Transcript_9204:454-738(-)